MDEWMVISGLWRAVVARNRYQHQQQYLLMYILSLLLCAIQYVASKFDLKCFLQMEVVAIADEIKATC